MSDSMINLGTGHASGRRGSASGVEQEHKIWLEQVTNELKAPDKEELKFHWYTHEEWCVNIHALRWGHYGLLDPVLGADTLWRFCSKPSTETIHITKRMGVDTIIDVVGKHSGGADKSNQDVRTSSFCRNPGTLIGTAASAGGDKKVLNIINKAEYLVRIDISTLAAKGISAHPAAYRAISLFETEYVLIPTPGAAECSLTSLATTIYANPFKNCIDNNGIVSVGSHSKIDLHMANEPGFRMVCEQAQPVTPEPITTAELMKEAHATTILKCAAASCVAANEYSSAVQDKDRMHLKDHTIGILFDGITSYSENIRPQNS